MQPHVTQPNATKGPIERAQERKAGDHIAVATTSHLLRAAAAVCIGSPTVVGSRSWGWAGATRTGFLKVAGVLNF
ncbi:hypothetical protein JMJ78_0007039 [Colletotrichum scovillei]|nr:hypothetical protein JMJ78_0007039 [Colletotrichum scovillei]